MSSSVDSKNDQMVLFHFVNPHSRSVYIWDCLSQSSCILMFSRGCARGMTSLFLLLPQSSSTPCLALHVLYFVVISFMLI
ncbi:hypothetical protein MtrunA17_Chr4g0005531 [Medicago truncatula]|uniref:Transmembrane protein n=1 Tax=Medicago truncatula TaxID=3880 RepID=A0A396I1K9_MEDTR|nr:hypothetical protein MtrunA17_Chr4g0005531 [Medicago truncatula]